MSRVMLHYILPLLLPTLVYFGWAWFANVRAEKRTGAAADARRYPWFWLAVSGFVAMVVVLGASVFFEGGSPGSTYHPPRYQNGVIVPGGFD